MSETKPGRLVKPKGRAVKWTDTQAEAQATPGDTDRQAARGLWARWVPARFRKLLDATRE